MTELLVNGIVSGVYVTMESSDMVIRVVFSIIDQGIDSKLCCCYYYAIAEEAR